jgi:purine-binding chemotaxis protein CheW
MSHADHLPALSGVSGAGRMVALERGVGGAADGAGFARKLSDTFPVGLMSSITINAPIARIEAFDPNRVTVLLVKTGGLLCALPIPGVIETMRPLPVTSISGTSAFVLGMCVVRGETVAVVDLAILLGLQPNHSNRSRLISMHAGPRVIAASVDSVVGLRIFDRAAFSEVPLLLQQAHPEVLKAVGVLERELLVVLDGSRIVSDEVLAQLPDAP